MHARVAVLVPIPLNCTSLRSKTRVRAVSLLRGAHKSALLSSWERVCVLMGALLRSVSGCVDVTEKRGGRSPLPSMCINIKSTS